MRRFTARYKAATTCAAALLLFGGVHPSFAQNDARPIPPFTPGHTVRVNTTSGVWSDAGGAAGSDQPGINYLTELGITNTGTPLCINDALTSGPYHQICLGANALGGGLLSYNAYGGASALPLQCSVNGSLQSCFGTAANGITGPITSAPGDMMVFADTLGHAASDPGVGPILSLPGYMAIANNSAVSAQTGYTPMVPGNGSILTSGLRAEDFVDLKGTLEIDNLAPAMSIVNDTLPGQVGFIAQFNLGNYYNSAGHENNGPRMLSYAYNVSAGTETTGLNFYSTGAAGAVTLEYRFAQGLAIGDADTQGFGTLSVPSGGFLSGDYIAGPFAATAIATNANGPFMYVSSSAGAPTGSPTYGSAGLTACEYDTTNHKLWCYEKGTTTWRGVVLAP